MREQLEEYLWSVWHHTAAVPVAKNDILAIFAAQVRLLDETPPDDFTRLAQVSYRAGIIHAKAAVLALIEGTEPQKEA